MRSKVRRFAWMNDALEAPDKALDADSRGRPGSLAEPTLHGGRVPIGVRGRLTGNEARACPMAREQEQHEE